LWRPQNAKRYLFYRRNGLHALSFITHSGDGFKSWFCIVPASVAGEGVRPPPGPRTGNSSGVRPGSSSGLDGWPGSCIGGGTSGRGFPGGLSCGGSDGCPGLIGGSSCGSIGISLFPDFQSGVPNPKFAAPPMREL
jgi:hypothetical protein